jgi:hypothetical protein
MMGDANFQTVRLARGRHRCAEDGACVMELASMLAGERFTDRPKAVCPVIAAFLRGYNDALPDGERDEPYRFAVMVLGSARPWRARRERARRLARWARDGQSTGMRGLLAGVGCWALPAAVAVETATRVDPGHRRRRVDELIKSLLDVDEAPMVSPEQDVMATHLGAGVVSPSPGATRCSPGG